MKQITMKINKIVFFIISVFMSVAQAQSARIFTLSADDWAQPRSGQVMVSFSNVKGAVEYWEQTLDAVLLVRYPGEDSGELWASELKDWLISLGVPNDYIILASGLDTLDEIEIIVAKKYELSF